MCPSDLPSDGTNEPGAGAPAERSLVEAESLQILRAWVRLLPDRFPGHVALGWYEGLTNALHDAGALPANGIFHRFRRSREVAYLWFSDGEIFLSPWHPPGARGRTVRRVETVGEALDLLAATPPPRPWWRAWG